jgi:hypothetical protein
MLSLKDTVTAQIYKVDRPRMTKEEIKALDEAKAERIRCMAESDLWRTVDGYSSSETDYGRP